MTKCVPRHGCTQDGASCTDWDASCNRNCFRTPLEEGGSLELDTATFNPAVTFLGLGEVEELADADIYEGDREGTYVVDTTPGEEDGSFILKENTDGTSDIINVYKSTNDADGEKYVVDYSYGEDGGAFIINTFEGEYAAVYNS